MTNQLGPTYKKLRVLRGFKAKEVAEGICTPQFLARFERGQSGIQAEKLIKLLNKIFISMEEFMIMYEGENVYEYNKAVNEMNDYSLTDNIPALLNLAKRYNQKEPLGSPIYQLVAIAIRARAFLTSEDEDISKEEIEKVKNHLDKIESWGIFELFLFSETVRFFSDHFITYNYKKIMAREVQYTRGMPVETSIILDTALNLATYFVSRVVQTNGEDQEAYDIANMMITDGLEFLQGSVGNAYPAQKLNYRIKKSFLSLVRGDEQGLYDGIEVMKIFSALGDREGDVNAIYHALKHINKTGIDIDSLL